MTTTSGLSIHALNSSRSLSATMTTVILHDGYKWTRLTQKPDTVRILIHAVSWSVYVNIQLKCHITSSC